MTEPSIRLPYPARQRQPRHSQVGARPGGGSSGGRTPCSSPAAGAGTRAYRGAPARSANCGQSACSGYAMQAGRALGEGSPTTATTWWWCRIAGARRCRISGASGRRAPSPTFLRTLHGFGRIARMVDASATVHLPGMDDARHCRSPGDARPGAGSAYHRGRAVVSIARETGAATAAW